jgi:hypothetical protein
LAPASPLAFCGRHLDRELAIDDRSAGLHYLPRHFLDGRGEAGRDFGNMPADVRFGRESVHLRKFVIDQHEPELPVE